MLKRKKITIVSGFYLLRNWWHETRSSFWFVPGMIVAGAVTLAAAVVSIDAHTDFEFVKRWSLLFGAGAAGSRDLLSGVAGSMITVTGIVFSITIVALSLTSNQYTSRVLRNFMRDKSNQIVLGVFVGIFAYCLVVLRTIRDSTEGAFVPSLAVFVGLLLAFVGIAVLIFFIHHISMSIQASTIIATAAQETINTVDRLFPDKLGKDADEICEQDEFVAEIGDNTWTIIPSPQTGYIETVDEKALLDFAAKNGFVLRMEGGVGEFIIDGSPLLSVSPRAIDEGAISELQSIYLIGRYRTVELDAGFGIRQLVDIALKALSPGVNDTTTAVMCVDYLTAILVRLAPRQVSTSRRFHEGELRLIARGPSFESLLKEAFNQIRQSAEGNVAVLLRQLQSLVSISDATSHPVRRKVLQKQADLLAEVVERTVMPKDGEELIAAIHQLIPALKI